MSHSARMERKDYPAHRAELGANNLRLGGPVGPSPRPIHPQEVGHRPVQPAAGHLEGREEDQDTPEAEVDTHHLEAEEATRHRVGEDFRHRAEEAAHRHPDRVAEAGEEVGPRNPHREEVVGRRLAEAAVAGRRLAEAAVEAEGRRIPDRGVEVEEVVGLHLGGIHRAEEAEEVHPRHHRQVEEDRGRLGLREALLGSLACRTPRRARRPDPVVWLGCDWRMARTSWAPRSCGLRTPTTSRRGPACLLG